MTMPCYKKRPKWWMTLLEIFHITERQYWVYFFLAIGIAITVFLVDNCRNFTCHFPVEHLFIYQYICCIIPTAPFGYSWSQQKFKQMPESWLKTVIATGSRASMLETIASLISPIIVIQALIKHYSAR